MKLWYWQRSGGLPNFGDELTAPLIEKLLGQKVDYSPLMQASIVGAGSTLGSIAKKRPEDIPFIWGTGFMWPGPRRMVKFAPMHRILALRGRLTLSRISENQDLRNIPLGDPGLLISLLLDEKPKQTIALGLIPHYADKSNPTFLRLASLADTFVIDVERSPVAVAKDIARCETVLSSSLHGLITADSLGIPNRHLIVSDNLSGGVFKFDDYYSAFSKRPYIATRASDLDSLSTEQINERLSASFIEPSELPRVQADLIEALMRASRLN